MNFGEDLVRVHKMMTRGLEVSTTHSADLMTGFDRYIRALINVLHVHHHGEDTLCWPTLRRWMPSAPYATLVDQHATLSEGLNAAEGARKARDWAAVHMHLDGVTRLWREHIGIEEGAFTVEATARAMPDEEHDRLTRRLVRHAQLNSRPPFLVLASARTGFTMPPYPAASAARRSAR
ncbi:MAG: hemerythrin domain-containing protein [Anaerolineae bacterium]